MKKLGTFEFSDNNKIYVFINLNKFNNIIL